MVASLTRARINHSSCSSFSMPETRCTFGGAPSSTWTGKTEREGTGHKGGHDLTAAPGYFQAKLHLARLTGNCTISETPFPGPHFPSRSFSQSQPLISSSLDTAALLFQEIQGRIWAASHHPLPRILRMPGRSNCPE